MNSVDSIAQNKQIRGEVYKLLREELSNTAKNSSKTFLEKFVQNTLSNALKNPNCEAAKQINKIIFTDDIMERLDAETDKLILRDKEFAEYRLYKNMFDKQRQVVLDVAESRKCIVCSRRAGKTETAARLLVHYCIDPNTPVLYIHNKIDNAMSQCWPLVIKAAKSIELQMKRVDKQNMLISFTNGSTIKFAANHDKSSAALLRGGKYKLIIVDEAQSHRNMDELIDDVCSPMLLDFPNSCLVLQGTPPRTPNTYFEKAWKSGKWKQYHWTAMDNPYVQDVEAFIQNICETKGIDINNSLIQREYLGEFVYDTEAQVFSGAKTYEEEPNIGKITNIVIGMDFGFSDYNSCIGLAVNAKDKKAYVYGEWKQNKTGVTEIIAAAKSIYDLGLDILRKNGVDPDGHIHMFGDNSDQSILYEMRKKHGLPTYNAYKFEKIEGIARLVERLALGEIQVPKDGILADEFLHIMYERDDEDRITSEIDDSVYHPEATMSLLYASRYIEQLFLAEDTQVLEQINYGPLEKVIEAQKDEIPDYMLQQVRNTRNKRGRKAIGDII